MRRIKKHGHFRDRLARNSEAVTKVLFASACVTSGGVFTVIWQLCLGMRMLSSATRTASAECCPDVSQSLRLNAACPRSGSRKRAGGRRSNARYRAASQSAAEYWVSVPRAARSQSRACPRLFSAVLPGLPVGGFVDNLISVRLQNRRMVFRSKFDLNPSD